MPLLEELPKLTVVTPSFNQGNFLEWTIGSVLNQQYPNLEYLIMDGGSTDNTVHIIKKYEKCLHYWRSGKDNGQAAAINEGFKRGAGEILTFINSDDLLLPDSLHSVAAFAMRHPRVSVFYGDIIFIDANNRVMKCYHYPPVYKWITWNNMFLPQPGVFFRRSAWQLVGGLDESMGYAFDRDFWFRLLQARCRFAPIGMPTAAFRKHAASKGLSAEWFLKSIAEGEVLERRYLSNANLGIRWASRCAFYGLQLALLNYPQIYLSRFFNSQYRRLIDSALRPPPVLQSMADSIRSMNIPYESSMGKQLEE